MKVKDFLAHLNNLPEAVKEQEIVLVVNGSIHLTSDVFGCTAEPFYWNCDYGVVDETTAKKHIAEVEPEFELSMSDFEMMYPTHTVFLTAHNHNSEPTEPTLAEHMHEVVAKYDDNATDFAQGGIPHLKLVID